MHAHMRFSWPPFKLGNKQSSIKRSVWHHWLINTKQVIHFSIRIDEYQNKRTHKNKTPKNKWDQNHSQWKPRGWQSGDPTQLVVWLIVFLRLECVLRLLSKQATELSTTAQILEFFIYIHGTIFHGELQKGLLLGNSPRSNILDEVTHELQFWPKSCSCFKTKMC